MSVTNEKSETEQAPSIHDLWTAYQNQDGDPEKTLGLIETTLGDTILENPQLAALTAAQIIGGSKEGSDSERMAIDVFKRASVCVEAKNPLTLVNMFQGCSQRMGDSRAGRIIDETRSFLKAVQDTAGKRSFH